MNKVIDIHITAAVPDDEPELAHEAVVATKAAVTALVARLHKMGLTEVTQSRRIMRRHNHARTEDVKSALRVVDPAA